MYVSMCAADMHAGDARLLRALDIREIMALRATGSFGYARPDVTPVVSVISALWASDRHIHRSDPAVA